jgi:hypothetical protein
VRTFGVAAKTAHRGSRPASLQEVEKRKDRCYDAVTPMFLRDRRADHQNVRRAREADTGRPHRVLLEAHGGIASWGTRTEAPSAGVASEHPAARGSRTAFTRSKRHAIDALGGNALDAQFDVITGLSERFDCVMSHERKPRGGYVLDARVTPRSPLSLQAAVAGHEPIPQHR